MEFINDNIQMLSINLSSEKISTSILSIWLYGYGLILIIEFMVSYYIGRWGVFKKISIKPWKALIPFYSGFVCYKKFFKWWVYVLKTLIVFMLIPTLYLIRNLDVVCLPYTFLAAVILILLSVYIVVRWNVSEAFDCSKLFFIGLVFFPPVFVALLGWDNKKYNEDIVQEEMLL